MNNLELLQARMTRAVDDPEAFYEILDPTVEWDVSDTSSPMAGIYHGPDEVRDFYRRWSGAFSDWDFDIERFIEVGDQIVAFVREHGRGRGSGVEVGMRRANVWTFRDGKVIRFRSFATREAALEAVGLDPDSAA